MPIDERKSFCSQLHYFSYSSVLLVFAGLGDAFYAYC